MTKYKSQPITFTVDSDNVVKKRMASFLPFSGIEMNENPLSTTAGSASDLLNMTVDDNSFLTLRPRLEEDPVFVASKALAQAKASLEGYSISDSCELKDKYLFLASKIVRSTDSGGLVIITVYSCLAFVTDSSIGEMSWLDLGSGMQSAISTSFSSFLIFPESDYFRFLLKATGKSYILRQSSGVWSFSAEEPYIPTYKADIKTIESMKDSAVYEDLSALTPLYKISFVYDAQSELDLDSLAKNAVSVSGPAYEEKSTDASDRNIIYYSDSGYIYFFGSDYTASQAISTGFFSLSFFYWDHSSETSALAFSIKVYADSGDHSDGISKDRLGLLYQSGGVKDYNGSNAYRFMYDASSNTFCRVRYEHTSGSSTIVSWVHIQTYSIGTCSFKDLEISTPVDYSDDCWHYMYSGSIVALMVNGDIGIGLLLYDLYSETFYTLIGYGKAVGTSGLVYSLVPAWRLGSALGPTTQDIPFDAIKHVFVANGEVYVASSHTLAYLIKQNLAHDADRYLTPNIGADAGPAVVMTDSDRVSCLYYGIGSTIDETKFADLTSLTGFSFGFGGRNRFAIGGAQALFYYDVPSMKPKFCRVPLGAMASADSFSIAGLLSAQIGFSPTTAAITAWGSVMLAGGKATPAGGSVLTLAKIDVDATIAKGTIRYLMVAIGTRNGGYFFAFPTAVAIDFKWVSSVGRILLTDKELEYMYSLENNATNPLVVDSDSLAKWSEFHSAMTFADGVCGTALIGSSRAYYNENYVFFTEPGNYAYIPTIHCHKAAQPLRFASSYLQTVGVMYERNNIEYVSWQDNPLSASQYTGHASILLFQSVEQRAIDYSKNGHLVTFAGVTVYINDTGLYALNFDANTPQDTERKASLVSKPINAKLLKEDASSCFLANADPYVLLLFPKAGHTSVYAFKALSSQWYYWEFPIAVSRIYDDNAHLRLFDGRSYYRLTDVPTPVSVGSDIASYQGNAETYLDFGTDPIKWMWKSQLLSFGSPTSQKQVTDAYFTFVNQNAGITVDDDTHQITQNRITAQRFGLSFYSYREMITESPSVQFEGQLNIINNLHRRTYLNRFKFCQILCYNIDDDPAPSDKVRLANLVIVYKYLTGGK